MYGGEGEEGLLCDTGECHGVGSVIDVLCVGLCVAEDGGEGAVEEIINLDKVGVGCVIEYHGDGGIIGDEVCVE